VTVTAAGVGDSAIVRAERDLEDQGEVLHESQRRRRRSAVRSHQARVGAALAKDVEASSAGRSDPRGRARTRWPAAVRSSMVDRAGESGPGAMRAGWQPGDGPSLKTEPGGTSELGSRSLGAGVGREQEIVGKGQGPGRPGQAGQEKAVGLSGPGRCLPDRHSPPQPPPIASSSVHAEERSLPWCVGSPSKRSARWQLPRGELDC
jgi:hypothetical protein